MPQLADTENTLTGCRGDVEIEDLDNPRGGAHRTRIKANDPTGIVKLRRVE